MVRRPSPLAAVVHCYIQTWNREKGFPSVKHMVYWFNEARRFGPKVPSSVTNSKAIINGFVLILQLKKAFWDRNIMLN